MVIVDILLLFPQDLFVLHFPPVVVVDNEDDNQVVLVVVGQQQHLKVIVWGEDIVHQLHW